MPERTFFSFRFAIPGYTVICVSIIIGLPQLIHIFPIILGNISIELFSVLFGFLTLLSGSALGFIISQIWYVTFHWFLVGRIGRLREMRIFLQNEYGLTQNRRLGVIFSDFLHGFSSSNMKKYIERRFDLVHTMGSTLIAFPIGGFIGYLLRFNFFNIAIPFQGITNYDIIILITLLVFEFFLATSLVHVSREHARATEISIRDARGFLSG